MPLSRRVSIYSFSFTWDKFDLYRRCVGLMLPPLFCIDLRISAIISNLPRLFTFILQAFFGVIAKFSHSFGLPSQILDIFFKSRHPRKLWKSKISRTPENALHFHEGHPPVD